MILQEHAASCDYEEINCVFEDKCKTKLLKKNLAEHLEKECSQRKARCKYCNDELPFSDLEVRCGLFVTFDRAIAVFASWLFCASGIANCFDATSLFRMLRLLFKS